MPNYNELLKAQFGHLTINLVKHDTSISGYPCYIEMHLGRMPKDKGQVALDAGNYVSRTTGLSFESVPEYRGRGKTATIRWFMTWEQLQPIIPNIHTALGKWTGARDLPWDFNSLIIQNKGRNVAPKQEIV